MKNERSMRGAILILWTAAMLGTPGCVQDDAAEDTGAGGSTAMMDGSSTGGEESGDESTTVIPPADTGTDDAPAGDPTCEEYCGVYLDACQNYSEYANQQHCMDNCAQWPVGAASDVGGDSLGCRTYHATVAGSTDPALHCPHAGPAGDMTCVNEQAPTCELYCTRYFNNCDGDLNLWPDRDTCRAECASWYPGSATDDSGHSIGCRAYYANLAAADPDVHCPNAGPGGGEACVL